MGKIPFMEVFFFMTDFAIKIDRFMLDCAAKGLTEKNHKTNIKAIRKMDV